MIDERGEPAAAPAGARTASADLEYLFQEHHGKIFGAAYRITGSAQDAEDVLQTIFLRLLGRGGVLDLAPSPGAYLYRSAINAALDLTRSRARKRSVPLDDIDLEASRGTSPDRASHDKEIRRCLRTAILGLSPKSAEVFALRFLEGMGNREIAQTLQSSQTAIGVMIHRARGRVKSELASCVGELGHA